MSDEPILIIESSGKPNSYSSPLLKILREHNIPSYCVIYTPRDDRLAKIAPNHPIIIITEDDRNIASGKLALREQTLSIAAKIREIVPDARLGILTDTYADSSDIERANIDFLGPFSIEPHGAWLLEMIRPDRAVQHLFEGQIRTPLRPPVMDHQIMRKR